MRRLSNGRSAELVGIVQPIVHCGEVGDEGRRHEVAERRVRAVLIVAADPPGDHRSRMVEVVEDRLVLEFVAHAPVEGFADAVLHRLAGRNEMPGDLGDLRPGEHGVGGDLRPVIGDDQVQLVLGEVGDVWPTSNMDDAQSVRKLVGQ